MIKKMTMLIVILVLVLGVAPRGAAAQTDSLINSRGEYIQFEYTKTKSLYGLQWTDENGILHVRHQTDIALIQGGLNGYAVVIFNCDLDTRTGNGKDYGTITIYETAGARPWPVQWSGEWSHEVRASTVVGGEMTAIRGGPSGGLLLTITQIYTARATRPIVLIHEGWLESIP